MNDFPINLGLLQSDLDCNGFFLNNPERIKWAAGSTGLELYNTADEVTNFERLVINWDSDEFRFGMESGGTALGRPAIGAPGRMASLPLCSNFTPRFCGAGRR